MITAEETIDKTSFATSFAWPAAGARLAPGGGGSPALPLTQAESRVLSLVKEGLSNKEISSVLGRAEPTIKHQVSACLRKFGVPSRSRLIAVAR